MLGRKKKEEELLDQSELTIDYSGSEAADPIVLDEESKEDNSMDRLNNLRDVTDVEDNSELNFGEIISEEKYVEDENEEDIKDESAGVNVENFLKIFSEDKQEEVTMSQATLRNLEEDIVLEKTGKKFSFKPILITLLFTLFIFAAVALSYVLSTFKFVLNYDVDNSLYTNEEVLTFSVVGRDYFCDINELASDQTILYTEEDTNQIFGTYKAFKIKEVKKSTVYGYDYDSKQSKEISIEKVCFIVNGDIPNEEASTEATK